MTEDSHDGFCVQCDAPLGAQICDACVAKNERPLPRAGETQLQRALAVLPSREGLGTMRSKHQALLVVLDEAQNEPPQGAADGSIRPRVWTQLRAVERRLSALLEAIDVYVDDGGELEERVV